MAKIPANVVGEPLQGLELVHRGKVRDTYKLPDGNLLMVASDRVSIFDFVLPALVPNKGAVLNALSAFFKTRVLPGEVFSHDLVACGSGIDPYLPENMRGNSELQSRASVQRKLKIIPVEAVVRGYLTGSALVTYRKWGHVQGNALPMGLTNGSELPWPIFTPTTKSEEGHDQPMHVHATPPFLGEKSLQIYQLVKGFVRERGLILADTKFEFGSNLELADECCTPDSSRYWDVREWERAHRLNRSPAPLDKQEVRNWGASVWLEGRDPSDEKDLLWTHALVVPPEVIARTSQIYRYVFWRLTGEKLERYQRESMGIVGAKGPRTRVEVVVGSRSDLPQMESGLRQFSDRAAGDDPELAVRVISCHRNPTALRWLAESVPPDRVFVAGAGKASALPGMLTAFLRAAGKPNPVIGVAFAGTSRDANDAARLSIEQLPDGSVLTDGDGKAYFGAGGFCRALESAFEDEFLPVKNVEPKPTELNVDVAELLGKK